MWPWKKKSVPAKLPYPNFSEFLADNPPRRVKAGDRVCHLSDNLKSLMRPVVNDLVFETAVGICLKYPAMPWVVAAQYAAEKHGLRNSDYDFYQIEARLIKAEA